MAKDESVVLVGHRWNNDGFLATKLDVDGVQLWQWEVRHLLSWHTWTNQTRLNAMIGAANSTCASQLQ